MGNRNSEKENKYVSTENLSGVIAESEEFLAEAKILALHLNVPVINESPGLCLRLGRDGLFLSDGELIMQGDFSRLLRRLRPSNLNGEMLVKASKISGAAMPLTVIDATAGMGEDSFLLAAAGFKVKLFERDKVIAALLADAMKRAVDDPELSDIVKRMEFTEGDSIEAMKTGACGDPEKKADIILLDPMFPQRQKSGLVKKKFQLLHNLERPCSDEEELLNAAIAAGPRRIVIKRPVKGPFLAGVKPSYSLTGKAVRYDCIALS